MTVFRSDGLIGGIADVVLGGVNVMNGDSMGILAAIVHGFLVFLTLLIIIMFL